MADGVHLRQPNQDDDADVLRLRGRAGARGKRTGQVLGGTGRQLLPSHRRHRRRRAVDVVGCILPPLQRAAVDGARRPGVVGHAPPRVAIHLRLRHLQELQAAVDGAGGATVGLGSRKMIKGKEVQETSSFSHAPFSVVGILPTS